MSQRLAHHWSGLIAVVRSACSVRVREVHDQLFAAASEGLLPDLLDVKLAAGDVSAAGELQHEVFASEGRDFSRAAIGDGRRAHAPVVQFHLPDEELHCRWRLFRFDADGTPLTSLRSRSSRPRSGKEEEPDKDFQRQMLHS